MVGGTYGKKVIFICIYCGIECMGEEIRCLSYSVSLFVRLNYILPSLIGIGKVRNRPSCAFIKDQNGLAAQILSQS